MPRRLALVGLVAVACADAPPAPRIPEAGERFLILETFSPDNTVTAEELGPGSAVLARSELQASLHPASSGSRRILLVTLAPGPELPAGVAAVALSDCSPALPEPLAVDAPYEAVDQPAFSVPRLTLAGLDPAVFCQPGLQPPAFAPARCGDRVCQAPLAVRDCCVDVDLTACGGDRTELLLEANGRLSAPGCANDPADADRARFDCGKATCEVALFPDTDWRCSDRSCAIIGCTNGKADCNLDPRDGCESSLLAADSCGQCGHRCPTGKFCADGVCACDPAAADYVACAADRGGLSWISRAADGHLGAAASTAPAVSGDGRLVAFVTEAALLPSDTNRTRDVYLYDLSTGRLTLGSVSDRGGAGNGASEAPALDRDGRWLAFATQATDVFPVPRPPAGRWLIAARDLEQGVTDLASDGVGDFPNGDSFRPQVSVGGRYVVFASDATNLVDLDRNGRRDVFRFDRHLGLNLRLSLFGQIEGDADADDPRLSADGSFAIFTSTADRWTPAAPIGRRKGFAVDPDLAAWEGFWWSDDDIEDATVDDAGVFYGFALKSGACGTWNRPPDVPPVAPLVTFDRRALAGACEHPVISGDGRYLAFESTATNVVAGDQNGQRDVFVFDLASGRSRRASEDPGDGALPGPSSRPSISRDGRVVAFETIDLRGVSQIAVRRFEDR